MTAPTREPDEIGDAPVDALFHATSVGMAEADARTRRFLRVNSALCEMTGYSEAELLGLTVDALTHPDDREIDNERFRGLLDGRDPRYEAEKRYLRKDGSVIWVKVSGDLRRDPSDEPGRSVAVIIDVTERRRAEEALRESEARFRERQATLRLAMRASRMGAWVRDVSTGRVEWDVELEELFGLPPGGFGSSVDAFFELVHPDDRQALAREIEAAVESHRDYAVRFRFLHRVDGWRWMEGRGRAVYDEGGRPARLYGIGMDVTDQHRAEEALRESEARYRALTEAVSNVVWTADASGAFVEPQDAWHAYTGQPWSEHRGFGWTEMLHPDDRDRLRAEWARTVARGGRYSTDGRVWHFGTRGWRRFFGRALPLVGPTGAVSGWIGTLTDVEDLYAAEEALGHQSELTRTVAENATAALFMMDADGRCTYMNPAAEAMTGYTLDDLRGIALHDAIHHHHPDGRPYPMSDCPIDRVLPEKHAIRSHEDVFVRRDGTFFPVVCSAEPIVRAGVPAGTVVEVRDVSEEKEAARALEETNARLRAALAVKDEFLGLVSHELRTPLTVILGMSKVLARGTEPDRVPEMAEDVAESADVLNALVESMLLLARLDHDEAARLREPVLLHRSAAAVLDERRAKDTSRRYELQIHAEHGLVDVQPTWLERVIDNLVGNAAKYSTPGRPVIVVVDAGEDEAWLSVLDEGAGVGEDEREKVFEPFYRSPSARARAPGAGLGLAVAKRIVELMGGRIWAATRDEGGAEFGFALPLIRDLDS